MWHIAIETILARGRIVRPGNELRQGLVAEGVAGSMRYTTLGIFKQSRSDQYDENRPPLTVTDYLLFARKPGQLERIQSKLPEHPWIPSLDHDHGPATQGLSDVIREPLFFPNRRKHKRSA